MAALGPGSGCWVSEERHNSTLRDLDRVHALLACQERKAASQIEERDRRISEIEANLREEKGRCAALVQALDLLRAERGSLSQGLNRLEAEMARLQQDQSQEDIGARTYRFLEVQLRPLLGRGTLDLRREGDRAVLSLATKKLFRTGRRKHRLRRKARRVLRKVAELLAATPGKQEIQVVGLVRPRSVDRSAVKADWKQAGAQAVAVARYLHSRGLPLSRLLATSRLVFLEPGATRGRARDRGSSIPPVEIVLYLPLPEVKARSTRSTKDAGAIPAAPVPPEPPGSAAPARVEDIKEGARTEQPAVQEQEQEQEQDEEQKGQGDAEEEHQGKSEDEPELQEQEQDEKQEGLPPPGDAEEHQGKPEEEPALSATATKEPEDESDMPEQEEGEGEGEEEEEEEDADPTEDQ